jgi:hypothetical protein
MWSQHAAREVRMPVNGRPPFDARAMMPTEAQLRALPSQPVDVSPQMRARILLLCDLLARAAAAGPSRLTERNNTLKALVLTIRSLAKPAPSRLDAAVERSAQRLRQLSHQSLQLARTMASQVEQPPSFSLAECASMQFCATPPLGQARRLPQAEMAVGAVGRAAFGFQGHAARSQPMSSGGCFDALAEQQQAESCVQEWLAFEPYTPPVSRCERLAPAAERLSAFGSDTGAGESAVALAPAGSSSKRPRSDGGEEHIVTPPLVAVAKKGHWAGPGHERHAHERSPTAMPMAGMVDDWKSLMLDLVGGSEHSAAGPEAAADGEPAAAAASRKAPASSALDNRLDDLLNYSFALVE